MTIKNKKCFICWWELKYFLSWKDFWLKTAEKTYNLNKCENCWLEMITPQPTIEEINSFYPKDYYSYIAEDISENWDWYSKLLIKYLNIVYVWKQSFFLKFIIWKIFFWIPFRYIWNNNFLDIWCWNWQILRLLSKYWWKTYWFDIWEKWYKNNIYTWSSLLDIDFWETKFDFIRLSHVLEHLNNPNEVLIKIKSLLSENWVLEITIPNTNWIISKIFWKYAFTRDIPRHLISYNYSNLDKFLKTNWFCITNKAHLLSQMFTNSLIFSTKDKFWKNIDFIQKNIVLRLLFFWLECIFAIIGISDQIWIVAVNKWAWKN